MPCSIPNHGFALDHSVYLLANTRLAAGETIMPALQEFMVLWAVVTK